ncbi:MAG: glycosyltransferase [Flavobacteriales bacterium]|nr:glycosyltransferase [Flavobacteriales bacterium]
MDINVARHSHILICPLDWGLGHATRCIPLIRQFLFAGKKVSIAGNGPSLKVLKIEFPEIRFFELPAYQIRYPKNGSYFPIQMALQSPKVLSAISKENKVLDIIIRSQKIDLVISDNRFGCYTTLCRSVFMTHQLNIALPKMLKWLNKVNRTFIDKFDEVWVPDFAGELNLSGKLSHESKKENVKFIGPLSRFQKKKRYKTEFDVLAIISGPEPQRTIFENVIKQLFQRADLRCALVRGLPNSTDELKCTYKVYEHLPSAELNELILKSDLIICRSGYSSIMDLFALGIPGLIIPTPGQKEQEYLANHLKGKFGLRPMDQVSLEDIELSDIISDIFSH